MHFHLPKPLHGWREFTGEVGIIVLGVLIALGAEQVVETWHWRKAAEQEKVSLNRDVSTTWQAMDARRIIEPCVARRLAELKQILDQHDSGADVKLKGPIGRPTVWRIGHPGLDMASSDGTLAHLPIGQRTAYFAVALDAQMFERAAWEERDSWKVIDRLDHIDRLTPEDWRDIHNAYENAVDNDVSLTSNLKADDPSHWMWGFRSFAAFPRNKAALAVPQVLNLCRSAI